MRPLPPSSYVQAARVRATLSYEGLLEERHPAVRADGDQHALEPGVMPPVALAPAPQRVGADADVEGPARNPLQSFSGVLERVLYIYVSASIY